MLCLGGSRANAEAGAQFPGEEAAASWPEGRRGYANGQKDEDRAGLETAEHPHTSPTEVQKLLAWGRGRCSTA